MFLLESDDEGVFDDVFTDEGVTYVSIREAALDLLTGPGRSLAEGEALVARMSGQDDPNG